MLIFVDYEHARGRATAWGETLLAARAWITYRLEDLSGMPCMLVRYDRVTPELVQQLDAKALFISGNGTDPDHYEPAMLEPLHELIREATLPVFGFCGGFQCMAQAHGVALQPISIEPDDPAATMLRPFGDGRLGELGYEPVVLDAEHELLRGVDSNPVFRHAHHLEVPTLPSGFISLASTAITPIQMAVDDGRLQVGTQFHPEYYTNEHPAGRMLIENFLRWSGVTQH